MFSLDDRKRFLLLVVLMAGVSLLVAALVMAVLYGATLRAERARLADLVHSQARLIEAVARFDAARGDDAHPGGWRSATLKQVLEGYQCSREFGMTGEFVLGRCERDERDMDRIAFLSRPRHAGVERIDPVPFDSERAVPMRLALLGCSGTSVGPDYRGKSVLAAYTPIETLDMGLVAKIDLSEIRAPFIRAGMWAAVVTIFMVMTGALLFVRISAPMLQRLEESRDRLRQAQKMEAIGSLAGGMAHDFNNMLMAISGYADLALGDTPKESPLRKDLEEINKTASRAALLTRDILAFSRHQVLESQVVSLNTVASNVEDMLRRLIGERVDLKLVLSPDLELTEADPHQIEQVLMNLAVNARDAMPKGGKLTIETKNADLDEQYAQSHHAVEPGQYVLLSVSDTGCGMPKEIQDRIFEPFFSTKEKGKGTGFGLSTSYGIITQHGGHIGVYSEVGIGTTFKVYLPVTQKTEAEESALSGQPQTQPLGTELVLLVEDEAAVLAVLERNLKKLGYETVTASSGEEALKLLSGVPRPPDLLITDVVMPGVTGPELAREVKARHPDTKVMFISGYADVAVHIDGALKEEAYFLQKPFTAKDIAQKLREVLGEPPGK